MYYYNIQSVWTRNEKQDRDEHDTRLVKAKSAQDAEKKCKSVPSFAGHYVVAKNEDEAFRNLTQGKIVEVNERKEVFAIEA